MAFFGDDRDTRFNDLVRQLQTLFRNPDDPRLGFAFVLVMGKPCADGSMDIGQVSNVSERMEQFLLQAAQPHPGDHDHAVVNIKEPD